MAAIARLFDGKKSETWKALKFTTLKTFQSQPLRVYASSSVLLEQTLRNPKRMEEEWNYFWSGDNGAVFAFL